MMSLSPLHSAFALVSKGITIIGKMRGVDLTDAAHTCRTRATRKPLHASGAGNLFFTPRQQVAGK